MTADLTAVTYFAPIAAFLIIFIVAYAIFAKTKLLGENNWLNIFVSFLIATLFVSVSGAQTYVRTVVPWFAVLMVTFVFILAIVGLIGKPMESLNKPIGIIFIVILGLVFLISAFFVFSDLFISYLPGPGFGMDGDPKTVYFLDWVYSPRVAGAALLIILSAVASWVLVKAK